MIKTFLRELILNWKFYFLTNSQHMDSQRNILNTIFDFVWKSRLDFMVAVVGFYQSEISNTIDKDFSLTKKQRVLYWVSDVM
jgi:hypothetical protein